MDFSVNVETRVVFSRAGAHKCSPKFPNTFKRILARARKHQNFLYLQTNFGKSLQALALLNMTLLFASASLFTTTNL